MSITRRTNQGGSIVSFIIVGLVLTLLLAGAAYYVNQRGEQARKDQSIADLQNESTGDEVAADDSSSDNEAVIPGDTSVDESNDGQALPETGIEIAFSELIGAFLLTASTTSYANSRRRATAHL